MPKKSTSPKKKTCAIIEEYPDGMTREEYELYLRIQARTIARLLLQHYPEILEEVKSIELKKAA